MFSHVLVSVTDFDRACANCGHSAGGDEGPAAGCIILAAQPFRIQP
jgi:hypothetical protein